MSTQEIIFVEEDAVVCDGSGNRADQLPGHPKVFLTFKSSDKTDSIICPYCSKQFKRKRASSPSKKTKDNA
ncbi:MAG: zinc-finger domain-containing protein [Alphaproteobacteria bacterium]|nr:zinc-finger domain-containing protein [Alphaproteobacteria bacterium]